MSYYSYRYHCYASLPVLDSRPNDLGHGTTPRTSRRRAWKGGKAADLKKACNCHLSQATAAGLRRSRVPELPIQRPQVHQLAKLVA